MPVQAKVPVTASLPKAWMVTPVMGPDEGWRARAACVDADQDLFFPVGVTGPAIPQIAAAKAVCARCPVRADCLEFAVATNQEYGVWGGTCEEERRALRRAWRARRAS
jgi:WhiB family transcriptional regulator, redox-sensing transcriptional regulator